MSRNEIETYLAVAVLALESAKAKLVPLYDKCYPHMFDETERREWATAIASAHVSVRDAGYQLDRLLAAPALQDRSA